MEEGLTKVKYPLYIHTPILVILNLHQLTIVKEDVMEFGDDYFDSTSNKVDNHFRLLLFIGTHVYE